MRDVAFLVWALVASVALPPSVVTAQSTTTLSLQGTIDRYTPATHTLSLSTPRGTVRFFLTPTIRIRQGRRRLEISELQRWVGHRATVRYTQSGDQTVVESVHVFGR